VRREPPKWMMSYLSLPIIVSFVLCLYFLQKAFSFQLTRNPRAHQQKQLCANDDSYSDDKNYPDDNYSGDDYSDDNYRKSNKHYNKKKKVMTASRLQNIANYYTQRYQVSGGKLTFYLQNRLYLEVPDKDERQAFATETIPKIVEKLKQSGALNDREVGAAKLRNLLRTGHSLSRYVILISISTSVIDVFCVLGCIDG
jgi:hypothetical protein